MHEQDITRRQPGHHLSQMERGRIAELYTTGTSKREIAAKIGVCHQTINNEIDRGTVKQAKRINGKLIYHTEYSPEAAQTRYETARQNKKKPPLSNH
nr:helix-turn-helix domain-containing protein [Pediococcus pentosaceus]